MNYIIILHFFYGLFSFGGQRPPKPEFHCLDFQYFITYCRNILKKVNFITKNAILAITKLNNNRIL